MRKNKNAEVVAEVVEVVAEVKVSKAEKQQTEKLAKLYSETCFAEDGKRSKQRKATGKSSGRDCFGCRIGAATNVVNAMMLKLQNQNGDFSAVEVDIAYREHMGLASDAQIRPQGPHFNHLKQLDYATNEFDGATKGRWQITARGLALIAATVASADDKDELAMMQTLLKKTMLKTAKLPKAK